MDEISELLEKACEARRRVGDPNHSAFELGPEGEIAVMEAILKLNERLESFIESTNDFLRCRD